MSTPDTFMELLTEELSPAPDPEFAAEMDAWVEGGFQRRHKRRGPSAPAWLHHPARALRSPLGMAGASTALAAAVIAALLVADSAQQTTTDQHSSAASPGQAATQPAGPSAGAAPRNGAVDQFLQEAPGPAGGVAPGEQNRRIERSSVLTLATPADDFQSTADKVLRVTDAHRGYVLRSNVSTGDQPSGDFQLRIPADQLQAALRDLSALGDVKGRSDTGQDVTRDYVSATDRLAAARAERRSLLRRLATANDDARIQRLRDRLDQNGRELASLRGQIRDLRERTNYASVSVTLVEKKGGHEGGGAAGGSGTDDALDDSLGLLVGSFNWLLRALGVLIPAGLLGGAAWWAARTFRRRRREAVLF
jgi:hypothetical protein